MIKIAICDDHMDTMRQLEQLIYKCFPQVNSGECRVASFSSGTALLERAEKESYDLYILDIVMPELSGIELAGRLAKIQPGCTLAFLTSSPEFAVDSYELEALDYLLKPVKPERLIKLLSRFLRQYQPRQEEEIVLWQKNTMTRIAVHNLCYLEALNHQIIYHTADNREITSRQPLHEAEEKLLERSNFFKANRSQLINFDYVEKIQAGCIVMQNGDKLYASRSAVGSMAEAYLKYKFGEI